MRIRFRILFDADADSDTTFLPDRIRIRIQILASGCGTRLPKLCGSGSTVLILNTLFCQVAKYEATIETYKKRLEEMGDLRGQIKYLEEKNTEYIQKNLDLEDELGNLNKKRPQVCLYFVEFHQVFSSFLKGLSHEIDLDFDCRT